MSTRCNITLHNGDTDNRPVILYHHYDGNPDFQMAKLRSFLKSTYEALQENKTPYWWDPERVAAVMIKNSADNYTRWDRSETAREECGKGIVPSYQPCARLQCDIQYLYRVVLNRHNSGKATIYCYSVESILSDFEEITLRNPFSIERCDFSHL